MSGLLIAMIVCGVLGALCAMLLNSAFDWTKHH
jgi:hypothetical protein